MKLATLERHCNSLEGVSVQTILNFVDYINRMSSSLYGDEDGDDGDGGGALLPNDSGDRSLGLTE